MPIIQIKRFFTDAFRDMKSSAQAQHEIDRAEFEAVRAEARADFEENRARNTLASAKAAREKQHAEKLEAAKQRIINANKRTKDARRS